MLYITQLIYLQAGQEAIFDQFEAIAIPIIAKYKGQMLLRMRTTGSEMISNSIEIPYEVHLVEFASEADFQQFMQDEERKQFLHLKAQSIRSSWLIKGERL